MLKKLLPTLALAAMGLLAAPTAQAQSSDGWHRCTSDELREQYLAQHPEARREHQRIVQLAEASMQAQQLRGGLNTALIDPADTLTNAVVPVVIHVIYYGIPATNTVAPSNVTDRQINDAMAILNRDFSRKNPDTTDVILRFKSRIANPGIRFRLARLDPNGNCTTGITRHNSPESDYGTANVTSIVYWPANKYLNVWVVDGISSGAGGYTFGGRDCTSNDGVVIRRSQFGPNTVCTANLCTRSLTHEVGHYFNLSHTWGQTNTPGMPANCNNAFGDGVADTPATAGVTGGGCNTAMAGCVPGTIANVQNYMDYADCEKMFTTGQKTLMRTFMLNSACRRTLLSAANLVATGTNDGFVSTPCVPIVFFNPTTTAVCEGGTVRFRDYSYNVNSSSGGITYAWSFPGGTPATAATVAPTVTYPTAGVYDVTLTVTSRLGGASSYTSTRLIRVNGSNSAEYAPLNESFEDPNAPFNYTGTAQQRNYTSSYTSPTNYSLTTGWQRRTTPIPAADGAAYLTVPNSQYPAGSVSVLTTPNINLALITSPVLSFSEYFQPRYTGPSTFSNLNLIVQCSNNCGLNWSQIAVYTALQLSQAGLTDPVPSDPTDWRQLTIPIPTPFHGSGTFQVRFTLTNSSATIGSDNSFFFDKLQITGPLGTHANALAQRGISIYPNPLTHETAVHLTLPASTPVQLRLTDVLGREVLALPTKTYPAGEQAISLAAASNGLPAGVYVVRITLDGQTYTSKLAVQ